MVIELVADEMVEDKKVEKVAYGPIAEPQLMRMEFSGGSIPRF